VRRWSTTSRTSSCHAVRASTQMATTTGKHHSFIRFFKFVGTDEYIQITFVSFRTDQCNVIFVSLGQEPMNIWAIWFDFDQPHIFVGDMAYIHRLSAGLPLWARRWIWKPSVSFSLFPALLQFIQRVNKTEPPPPYRRTPSPPPNRRWPRLVFFKLFSFCN
jgi:hypothetical protein